MSVALANKDQFNRQLVEEC